MRDNVMDKAMKLAKSQLSNFKTIKPSYEKLEAELSAMTQRAEAAEARIKASQEQEPVATKLPSNPCDERTGFWFSLADIEKLESLLSGAKLYSAPVIPPDVADLQRENTELTRKVGEQHNVLKYLMDRFDSETWQCENCGHAEDTETMDSAIYLREYLASAPQLGGSNE